MNEGCVIEETSPEHFILRGELSFTTVMGLLRDSAALLWRNPSVTLDLAGVTRTDSAGLALLVEWIRIARQRGKSIRFCNIPEQLMAVAQVAGLGELLPVTSP